MKVQNLLSELKRRRVFRVAVVYAGVAFIVFQVADFAFPALHVPDWFSSAIVVLLILGFFIAVGLAWAFDITEKGVVRAAKEPAEAKASRRVLIGNKTLAIVAAVAVAAAVWSYLSKGEQPGPITAIAVLPLENLMHDPDQDYFVDGMHEALVSELGKISALRVISRTSAMRYKESDKSLPEIAGELGVDAVVEGSVLRAGDQVRITAQLVGTKPERHLWTDNYNRDLRDILALHSEVARAIAKEIKVALTPEEEAQLTGAQQVDPEAYKAYLKGRYYWNKRTEEGLRKSLEYFQQATEKDPGYALPYAGLADAYSVLADWGYLRPKDARPRAKAAATKALEIDSKLAEARATLAFIRAFYDWDWAEAEQDFKQVIRLSPNYSVVHQWYAEYLTAMGRFDKALDEVERAQALDPLSLMFNAIEGWVLYFARRYDQAIDQCRQTLQMDPNFAPAHYYLSWCYAQKEMYEDAIEEIQKIERISGSLFDASVGSYYAKSGKRSEALEVIETLKNLSRKQYLSPQRMADIYIGLGEKDEAFRWLEKSWEERSYMMAFLKVSPIWDPLRSDPRFADLLRRMNFPE